MSYVYYFGMISFDFYLCFYFLHVYIWKGWFILFLHLKCVKIFCYFVPFHGQCWVSRDQHFLSCYGVSKNVLFTRCVFKMIISHGNTLACFHKLFLFSYVMIFHFNAYQMIKQLPAKIGPYIIWPCLRGNTFLDNFRPKTRPSHNYKRLIKILQTMENNL